MEKSRTASAPAGHRGGLGVASHRSLPTKRLLVGCSILAAAALMASPAHAYRYQFDDGVDIQFTNTLQYSILQRVAPESGFLAGAINANDGDNNLRNGIVSSRLDLLSQLNISYKDFGFDVSAVGFYDQIYNQHTQNHDRFTYNSSTEPFTEFPKDTSKLAGRDFQLRNLFAYGSTEIGGIPVTVRVGRFVNLFGESLFFAANGISYGQAPIDIERAESVPNTQAKDLFLPTGQAMISSQVSDSWSVNAYMQFEWEKFYFPPAGSYFSITDVLDGGAQRIIAVPPGSPAFPFGAGGYFNRMADQKAANIGPFGVAVHYDPIGGQWDFGLYAVQYNDTEPQIYVRPYALGPAFVPGSGFAIPPAFNLGSYQVVYPNAIQIYGASASTTDGPTNYAGEISVRTNEPLVSNVTLLPGQVANNDRSPAYAVGTTLHYQASAIYLGPVTRFWDSSSALVEVAGDNLLSITKNDQAFNPSQRHMALGFRSLLTANYDAVLPGLDLSPNLGIGWNFKGLAPDTVAFNNTGIDRGGDITLSLSFIYLNAWRGSVSYTRYVAPPTRNPYADRDFVGFNIERTF